MRVGKQLWVFRRYEGTVDGTGAHAAAVADHRSSRRSICSDSSLRRGRIRCRCLLNSRLVAMHTMQCGACDVNQLVRYDEYGQSADLPAGNYRRRDLRVLGSSVARIKRR